MGPTPAELPDKLIDRFGRHITYVRLSVTDRCDLRCVYCMAENMHFLPCIQVLTLEEITRLGKLVEPVGVKNEPQHLRCDPPIRWGSQAHPNLLELRRPAGWACR